MVQPFGLKRAPACPHTHTAPGVEVIMTGHHHHRKRHHSTTRVPHTPTELLYENEKTHETPARRPPGRRRLSTTPAFILQRKASIKPIKAWQLDAEGADDIFDVVADKDGHALLLPLSGGGAKAVADLPEDEPVTIRVFRFFEDKQDEVRIWEHDLRNVNSGSLLWVVVHLVPRMHSVIGAKFGKWFTAHHISVLPKYLKSGYFMCDMGACPLARTFGTTSSATKSLVSGEHLETGYFWFASPDRDGDGPSHKDVHDDACLQEHGWKHVDVLGLFDGDAFLWAWSRSGSSIIEANIAGVLRSLSPDY